MAKVKFKRGTNVSYDSPAKEDGSILIDTDSGEMYVDVNNTRVKVTDTSKQNVIDTHSIPSGGTTGQVLKKKTGTDYDVEWQDDTVGAVNSVNTKTGNVVLNAVDVSAVPQVTSEFLESLDKYSAPEPWRDVIVQCTTEGDYIKGFFYYINHEGNTPVQINVQPSPQTPEEIQKTSEWLGRESGSPGYIGKIYQCLDTDGDYTQGYWYLGTVEGWVQIDVQPTSGGAVDSVNGKTGNVVLDAIDVSAGLQLTGDEMVAKLQSLPLNTIIQCKYPSGVFKRGYFYRVSGTGTNRKYVQQQVQEWHSDNRKQDRFQFSGVELANDDLSELLTVGDIVQCTSDFINPPYANYIKGYFYRYGGGISNFTQIDVQPTSGGAVDSVNGKTGVVVLSASDVGALPDNTSIPTKVSDLQNDSGYITLSDIPSTDSVTQGSSNLLTSGGAYTALSNKQDTLSQSQLDAVNSGIDSTKVGQITTNTNDISTIEGKIPSTASSSNQLADKDYVIENIQTNAAIFRGNYATKAALLAVQWQTSDPEAAYYVTNNDYAYVEADETHNNEAWRYLYVIDDIPSQTGWQPQFKVNDTPFSQAQLNAINSGITSALVSNIPTNEQIATWNNKSDFSGSYNDLSDQPTIPSKTSDLINDSGFLTTTDFSDFSAQDIADLWDEVDV